MPLHFEQAERKPRSGFDTYKFSEIITFKHKGCTHKVP